MQSPREQVQEIQQQHSLVEQYKVASMELEERRSNLGLCVSDVEELSTSLQQALADREELYNEICEKERLFAALNQILGKEWKEC